MEIAEHAPLKTARREIRSYETILLVYSILTVMLLIGVYLDFLSAGTVPVDSLPTVAFP